MTMSQGNLTQVLVHMMEHQRLVDQIVKPNLVPKPTKSITLNDKVHAIRENHVGKDKPVENGIVRVMVKVNYGTEHFYPANPTAELFRKVQGGKTLTKATLKVLKDEGYAIQYRYEEPAI
jgi:hypothetical protein